MADYGLGVIVAGAIGASVNPLTDRRIGPITANVTIDERHVDELEVTDHPIEQGSVISDHAYKRPEEVTVRVAWSNSPGGPGSLTGGIAGALRNRAVGAAQDAVTSAAARAIGGSALGNLAAAKLSNLTGAGLTSLGVQVNTGTGKGTSKVQDVYASLVALQRSAVPFDVYTGKRVYRNMLMRTLTVETDRTTENALVATLQCRQVIIVSTQLLSVTASDVKQADPAVTAPPAEQGTKQLKAVDPTQNLTLTGVLKRLLR